MADNNKNLMRGVMDEMAKFLNKELVRPQDLQAIFHLMIAGVLKVKEEINFELDGNQNHNIKRIDDFITICEGQLENITKIVAKGEGDNKSFKADVTKINENATEENIKFRNDMRRAYAELKNAFNQIELIPGDDGNDAEFTEEIKQEIIGRILGAIKGKWSSELKKEVSEAVTEAVKAIKPQMLPVMADIGAPFEQMIKAGSNTTVRKDASGAWVIDASAGSSDSFAENEVASGSGTSFGIANTPILGSVRVFALGQRLTLTTDYTISGTTITTVSSWGAGEIVVDYRY